MVAYTKPQQRKKEEYERLRGKRDQIKFIDLRFERWQVVRFRLACGDRKARYSLNDSIVGRNPVENKTKCQSIVGTSAFLWGLQN